MVKRSRVVPIFPTNVAATGPATDVEDDSQETADRVSIALE